MTRTRVATARGLRRSGLYTFLTPASPAPGCTAKCESSEIAPLGGSYAFTQRHAIDAQSALTAKQAREAYSLEIRLSNRSRPSCRISMEQSKPANGASQVQRPWRQLPCPEQLFVHDRTPSMSSSQPTPEKPAKHWHTSLVWPGLPVGVQIPRPLHTSPVVSMYPAQPCRQSRP